MAVSRFGGWHGKHALHKSQLANKQLVRHRHTHICLVGTPNLRRECTAKLTGNSWEVCVTYKTERNTQVCTLLLCRSLLCQAPEGKSLRAVPMQVRCSMQGLEVVTGLHNVH